MAESDVILVGTIKKILYTNPENGYLVGTFITEKYFRPITVKGFFLNTCEHETLQINGCR